MWIITALVITFSFVLSSAQEAPPSPQCITAYNATFDEDTTGCSLANLALLLGNVTDEQRMMVCSPGQQCNTMIENVISVCGDTIEYPTRLTQDLVCTTGPNNTNCFTIFFSAVIDGGLDILGELGTECTGTCSQICMQALMQLNNSLGCCFVELLQGLIDSGDISSTQASLFANVYPEQCGLGIFTSCSGDPIPSDACGNATIALFGGNDECSMSVRELFFEDNELAIANLYNGDCPTRFYTYANACSEIFGDSTAEILQLATGILTISQATASNGRRCTELLPLFLSEDQNNEVDCIGDYFLNQCSSGCRDLLMNVTAEYGCCLNTVFAEFTGRSKEIAEQIEYPILTREIYSLCGISSPGFCVGTNPPPYTDAAEKCISTRDSFISDDTCLDYYYTLGERFSAIAVNSAATAICANQTCKNRMSDYIDFLITCRLENIINDDDDNDDGDDDDDEEEKEDTRYLDLAYVTGNTTCRVDNSNTTCYSSIYFNQQFALVYAAFASDNTTTAVCASAVIDSCPIECTLVLTTAYNSVGCCLGEYGRALLGADILATVSTRCGIPSLTDRCTEITAQQPERCTIAQNALMQSADTCGNPFFAFLDAYFEDDEILQQNLNQICQQDSCRNAVSEYLEACANTEISLGNDYEGLLMDFDGLACKQSNGNTKGDCFVLDESDPTITALGDAFLSGQCLSTIDGTGSCSSACRNTLQAALDSAGCCVALTGDVFFQQLEQLGITATVNEIGQLCNLPISRDCTSAAMEKKALSLTILLFLVGVMITMLA